MGRQAREAAAAGTLISVRILLRACGKTAFAANLLTGTSGWNALPQVLPLLRRKVQDERTRCALWRDQAFDDSNQVSRQAFAQRRQQRLSSASRRLAISSFDADRARVCGIRRHPNG